VKKEKELIEQIETMIQKSHRTLEQAKILFKEGAYDGATSRSYYAIFHLLQAVLLTKNLSFSKHSGVIGGFSHHFIKTGIFPEEFGEIIQRLRSDREIGDYDYEKTISDETAEEDIQDAEKIVSKIENYLVDFIRSE
jgi:uncharacterized protein (UPF0332 family)